MITDFTEPQLEKMQYRLEVLESMNSDLTSTFKFKDLKMFRDMLGNLFMSYVSINEARGTYDYFYIEFDREGKETLLNESGRFSVDELKDMFSTLQPFEL